MDETVVDALDMQDATQGAIDIEEIEERATQKALARLQAQMRPVQPGLPPSRFEQVKQELKAAGIDDAALDNWRRLDEARRQDEAAMYNQHMQKNMREQFIAECMNRTLEALEEVSAPIPAIKNAKMGLKQDLGNDIADMVMNDKRFADVRRSVESGKPPAQSRLKEAAAIVADRYCKEIGITKPSGGIDLASSKGEAKGDDLDLDSLPKAARQFYNISLNLGLGKEKALERARQALKELK